jgi:ribonuclease P protein component
MAAPPPTLKRRRDFLACARARRWAAPGLILQARRRAEGEPGEAGCMRVGYTCSKKLGGAVTRNRAKRRLRAAAAEVLASEGICGWDYVLVGRPQATVERPFAHLVDDLRTALGRVHAAPKVRA